MSDIHSQAASINQHTKSSHMSSRRTDEIISRHTLLWLLITNVAVLTPLYSKSTIWTLGICAICFVWRVGIYLGQVAKPPRLLVTLLAIGSAATLALVSFDIGILNALINLLILGYALKYIEMRSRRDVRAVVVVGYFLIALTFIEYQSLLNTVHLLVVTTINTCVLLSLYRDKATLGHTAKMGVKLILQSLPFALLLFVVLPRFAPLWMVPHLKSSKTGLSDNVSFGDISELTRSADLAFRATFSNNMPTNSMLYWRAIVLEDYDGKTWSQNSGIREIEKTAFLFQPSRALPQGKALNYEVIAEASNQRWLFGLDQAFSDTSGVYSLPDFRLFSLRSLDQRFQYRVTSIIDAPLDRQLSANAKATNLAYPSQSNPRTFALGQAFAQKYPQPMERLNAMMRYFTQEPYFYTLKPPPVGPQQIDDFLFENKAGFCEHYASAFVLMARASGLPARMVTGYQGGELNTQAGYFSVYQYMAHAWTEVWLSGQGWIRFDPTAMIAPDRIENGFDATFDSSESYLLDNPFSGLRFKANPFLNELRLRFASIDYYWSVWVLGFDSDRQSKVLRKLLGDVSSSKIALFMLASIGVIGLGIAYSAGLFSFERHRDPLSYRYEKLCRRLEKHGLVRHHHDGPSTIANQVAVQFPELSQSFSKFNDYYLMLKYQDTHARNGSTSRKKLQKLFNRQYRQVQLLLTKRRLNSEVF